MRPNVSTLKKNLHSQMGNIDMWPFNGSDDKQILDAVGKSQAIIEF